jgi:hypothetical protein
MVTNKNTIANHMDIIVFTISINIPLSLLNKGQWMIIWISSYQLR